MRRWRKLKNAYSGAGAELGRVFCRSRMREMLMYRWSGPSGYVRCGARYKIYLFLIFRFFFYVYATRHSPRTQSFWHRLIIIHQPLKQLRHKRKDNRKQAWSSSSDERVWKKTKKNNRKQRIEAHTQSLCPHIKKTTWHEKYIRCRSSSSNPAVSSVPIYSVKVQANKFTRVHIPAKKGNAAETETQDRKVNEEAGKKTQQ